MAEALTPVLVLTALMAAAICVLRCCAVEAVPMAPISVPLILMASAAMASDTPEILTVAATVPLVNPVAVAPDALAMTTMPVELVEFKSIPERKVVTVRSPETEPLRAMPV